jgi:putative ABC transport system substrate-binding protein
MASHIERREFLATLGVVAAWPLAAHAQQGAIPVIGILGGQSAETYVSRPSGASYCTNSFRALA